MLAQPPRTAMVVVTPVPGMPREATGRIGVSSGRAASCALRAPCRCFARAVSIVCSAVACHCVLRFYLQQLSTLVPYMAVSTWGGLVLLTSC
jgi:hypothetical protein